MSEVICYLLILAVLVWSGMRGFKKGAMRQLPSLIPLILGIIAVHIFRDSWAQMLRHSLPFDTEAPSGNFVYSNLSATTIFLAVYFVLLAPTILLSNTLRLLPKGTLGKILGCGLALVKATFWLSLIFNLRLAFKPDDEALMHSAGAGDGNLIEAVMWVTPALFGTPDSDDLHLEFQLDEARRFEHARGIGKTHFFYPTDLSSPLGVINKNINLTKHYNYA